ncbi:MAG TPA: glycosyltransferase 87 family protein [Candidatus Lokiarchaeia archaeon]|nr:glycosyltransferase 87 family protein [Candidatus Lokiarchaeia archaeon]
MSHETLNLFNGFVKQQRFIILVQVIYAVLTTILISYFVLYTMLTQNYLNDFAVYYYSSVIFHTSNPLFIFDPLYERLFYNILVWRYFPSILILFTPLTLLPLIPAFAVYNGISVVLNVLTLFVGLMIIKQLDASKNRSYAILAALCFVQTFNIANFGAGQISSFVAFTSMLSLYFLMKKKEAAGYILLGFTIAFKPAMIFVIILQIPARNLMRMIKRVIFIILPLSLDIALFLGIPGLLHQYIWVNFDYFIGGFYPSVSLASILINIFPNLSISTPEFIIMAGVLLIFAFQLRKRVDPSQVILFNFVFGAFIYFISYGTVWDSQFVYLFPFLALWFALNWKGDIIKLGLIFFAIPTIMDALYLLYNFVSLPVLCYIAPVLFLVLPYLSARVLWPIKQHVTS